MFTRRPPLPRPPALHVNTRRLVLIGCAIWFVAFLALLPFYGWLDKHDHLVWLWTCLAGWVLGLMGLTLMQIHHRSGRTD